MCIIRWLSKILQPFTRKHYNIYIKMSGDYPPPSLSTCPKSKCSLSSYWVSLRIFRIFSYSILLLDVVFTPLSISVTYMNCLILAIIIFPLHSRQPLTLRKYLANLWHRGYISPFWTRTAWYHIWYHDIVRTQNGFSPRDSWLYESFSVDFVFKSDNLFIFNSV